MPGLFSSVEQPDSGSGNFVDDYQKNPSGGAFGAILAAVMRGNAMVQGQSQAKNIAADQMDANGKMSVTITPNKTGGPPIVNLKNAPADLLNGTQQSDVEQAHDTPHDNVEKKIDELGIGGFRSDALRSIGYEPKSDQKFTPADTTTFRGAYRAQRDLGESPISAAIEAVPTKLGLFNRARVATDVNRSRAMQDTAAFKNGVEPVLSTEIAMQNAGNAAQRLNFERTRAEIADKKEQRTEIDSAIKNIDYGNISFAKWRAITENERGRPISDQEWQRVQDKGQRDISAKLDDAMKSPTFGSQKSAEDALASTVPPDAPIPPEKRQQFIQNFDAAQRQWNYKTEKEKLDLRIRSQENEIKAAAVYAQQNANLIMKAAQRGTGEKALEGLPEGTQKLIRGIASGQLDITKVTTARGGNRQAVSELVAAYDPTWSTAVAPARAATYRDFTSGQSFRNIVAINTAVHHLDRATASAAALENAGPQFWNKIKNYGLTQAGDSRVTKFMADVDALGGELAKTFSGKAGTDTEIKAAREAINSAQSPQQLKTALDEYVHLMGGRASALSDSYTAATGQAPPPNLIFSAESQRVLAKHGYVPTAAAAPGAAGIITDYNEILDIFDKNKKGRKQ